MPFFVVLLCTLNEIDFLDSPVIDSYRCPCSFFLFSLNEFVISIVHVQFLEVTLISLVEMKTKMILKILIYIFTSHI